MQHPRPCIANALRCLANLSSEELHPIEVVDPDVAVSESVMRQHPLLKRVDADTGSSKGLDRSCQVCYRGLNPEYPNRKYRRRCYTFCGGCNSGNGVKKRVYVHDTCYFFLPDHKGFTRMFTEKDGLTEVKLKQKSQENLDAVPTVSGPS
jgi:hypothetical protein